MMKGAFENVVAAVGQTPIVKLNRLASHVEADIYVKLEFLNPGGSLKDRPAIQMVLDAEADGSLRAGGTIVESTSGNTGMGLAMVAAIRGYKTVFVMPDKMSEEKIASLRAFGSRVVVTPTNVEPNDPRSYYRVAEKIVHDTPGAILSNQYHNPSNPKAHELSTGPEIWDQTGGEVDAMVVAMGTGGTISGLGTYLKAQKPSIQMVGVDPVGSIYYDYFRTGTITAASTYRVEGFGEDFLPSTMNFDCVDEVIRVSDKECFQWTRSLVRSEGIYAGGSSGGSVCAAVRYAETTEKPGNILVILPDGAGRYLSKIFNDTWMREGGFLDPDHGDERVADLLEQRGAPLVSASPGDSFAMVIAQFKEHGFSQLPVLDESGRLTGLIRERDMLEALLEKRADAETAIDDYLNNAYALVEAQNRTSLLGQILAQGKVVVVEERGRVTGILTNIDFIDWMAGRMTIS